jgi:hypothetical protein
MEKTVLNIERMLQTADALETKAIPGLEFNMGKWYARLYDAREAAVHPCRTVACIGGTAIALFGEWRKVRSQVAGEYDMEVGRYAMDLLGLTHDQAERLFLNRDNYISAKRLSDITREEAVAAIRRMVAEERGEQIAREIAAAQSEEAEVVTSGAVTVLYSQR